MTRIVVLPADETACGYYRMRLPAGAVALERPDWTVEVYRPSDVKLGGGANGELWAIHGIPDPASIDLLVMQRVGTPLQVNLLRWARSQGIATVLDIDDAMWCIDPDNSAYSVWHGDDQKWRLMDKAAEIVDLVTVTTSALSQRYSRKHGRCEVLPNCVPAEISEIESIRDSFDPTLTIGWAGFTSSHPHDLEVVGTAVRDIVDAYGVKVRVVGDAEGALQAWGLSEVDMVQPVPIGAPYYTALTSIDVALVPLADTPFNKAKSYLKALEFAALGKTVIASWTPANRALNNDVPVYLAQTPEDWHECLKHVIENQDVREHGALWNAEAVQKHCTYEGNAGLWVAAWERAMVRRSRLAV